MGHGIAISYALWGYPVILCDLNEEILNRGREMISSSLDSFVEEEVIPQKQAEETLARITTTTDLTTLASDVDFVCEAIVERGSGQEGAIQ